MLHLRTFQTEQDWKYYSQLCFEWVDPKRRGTYSKTALKKMTDEIHVRSPFALPPCNRSLFSRKLKARAHKNDKRLMVV